MSERRDVYGEVSREVSRIVRDVEYAGMDLRSALSNAVELSPSENYKEFLHGLITVIDSGGDVRMYLEERGLNTSSRRLDRVRGHSLISWV